MYQLSATELHAAFLDGSLSAEKITQCFLDRIQAYDKKVNAFISVFDEKALAHARSLDERRLKGERKFGKLAGVPIGIKDNIHIKGEKTTCASKMLENYEALFNSTVINLLENEDATFLGKLNMDEFAMGSSTEHSYFGFTANPWDLDCVPGGSSGGSAAAVAARLCPVALGSDTGGSVRQPAAFCGVVGLKPSYGRISRNGLVAFASSLDQIGPLATTMQDTSLLLNILGRHDKQDATSVNLPPVPINCSDKNIKGKTLGIPRDFLGGLSLDVAKNFEESLEVWKDQGGLIVDIHLEVLRYACSVYYILSMAEASSNLSRYDGIRYGHRSLAAENLEEVYALSRTEGFGKEVRRRIMMGSFVLSSSKKEAYYVKALAVKNRIIRELNNAFKICDFLATPVTPSVAFKRGAIMDPLNMYLQDIYTIFVNIAGITAISLPSGFNNDGMPYGFQLVGQRYAEANLCNAAYIYEKNTGYGGKMPPLFNQR
ncbi:Asp-tRNA(Asn)/Glu-tRNA(Gln) amidotransferase subunit GatA [Candidatus Clavichlamydia salmonicola]|uniref:Asp-tRNA(Asn)/Glu-tRNA(Gln) amidotransferase subunit GatA n=1 Tax=Candidatus Clavichlamydia salmonicola TaxID=469812 RepID=UPI001890D511|nr:Asp-tRNA(Asn)/Glu-tRNA(Gln) amidotransferase subunit GatA [Candidatus Clavichlamydia salmonicola]